MEIQIGMDEALRMGDDEAAYKAFAEKFKPKKTTDDCYTPPSVYEAVAAWVAAEYGVRREDMVRPFYPGGDYQAYEYRPDNVVVDNPPFSILAKIIYWYAEHGIKFFLFAPALTLFSARRVDVTYIPTGSDIIYENGANVKTSFITNMDGETRIRTAPDLHQAIDRANLENQKNGKEELPKYEYPDCVVTAAAMQRLSANGVDLRIKKTSCTRISAMDMQRANGKSIYGGGFLLSERAAAERAAAERAAAERAAARKAAWIATITGSPTIDGATIKWEISEHEKQIIAQLKEIEEQGGCKHGLHDAAELPGDSFVFGRPAHDRTERHQRRCGRRGHDVSKA